MLTHFCLWTKQPIAHEATTTTTMQLLFVTTIVVALLAATKAQTGTGVSVHKLVASSRR